MSLTVVYYYLCIVLLFKNLFLCIGTARTSLVVTIGPSPRHRGETSSTIMFGQRVSPMPLERDLKCRTSCFGGRQTSSKTPELGHSISMFGEV